MKEVDELTSKIVTYRTLQRYIEGFEKDGLLEWNGERGKGSRYALSNPDVVMSSNHSFSTNVLEILKNSPQDSRQTDLSSNVANDVNREKGKDNDRINDNYDNSRQNGMSLINGNDNKDLHRKKAFTI